MDALPAAADYFGVVFVHLENVTYGYPDGVRVLESLHLQIRAGEVRAVIGGSGAGKTTLQQCYPHDDIHDRVSSACELLGIELERLGCDPILLPRGRHKEETNRGRNQNRRDLKCYRQERYGH